MTALLLYADSHIGINHGARLAEQEDVWEQALAAAREKDVDAVLHLGDVWHTAKPSPEALLAFERPLARHVEAGGSPVYAINGNHCRAAAGDAVALDVFAEAGLLSLFTAPGVATIAGTQVVFLPWTSTARMLAAVGGGDRDDVNRWAAESLLATARGLRPAVGPSVLALHWAIGGASLSESVPLHEPVLPLAELAALGYDAVVAGHLHRGEVLWDDGCVVAFVGSPMALDQGEGGYAHGCALLEVAA